jgi:hypothetical protein
LLLALAFVATSVDQHTNTAYDREVKKHVTLAQARVTVVLDVDETPTCGEPRSPDKAEGRIRESSMRHACRHPGCALCAYPGYSLDPTVIALEFGNNELAQ